MDVFRRIVATSIVIFAVGTPMALVLTRGVPELAPIVVELPGVTTELPPQVDGEPVVNVQIAAEVGELVRLSTPGDDVAWKVIPPSTDFESCGEQRNDFFGSFRKSGEYHIIAGVVTSGKASLREAVVSVGSITPDTPDVIVPPPDPTNTWDGKIASWLGGDIAKKAAALRVAVSFEEAAAEIEAAIAANKLLTAENVVTMTAEKNRAALGTEVAAWQSFQGQLAAELRALAQAGALVNMRQHADTWRQIAGALRRFSA
jgi:hypothetical protein